MGFTNNNSLWFNHCWIVCTNSSMMMSNHFTVWFDGKVFSRTIQAQFCLTQAQLCWPSIHSPVPLNSLKDKLRLPLPTLWCPWPAFCAFFSHMKWWTKKYKILAQNKSPHRTHQFSSFHPLHTSHLGREVQFTFFRSNFRLKPFAEEKVILRFLMSSVNDLSTNFIADQWKICVQILKIALQAFIHLISNN